MTVPATGSLWGWTHPVRGRLTLLASIAAIGLILSSRTTEGPPSAVAPTLVVDLNTAPPEVLGALPRLGPSLIRRIVAARAEAPFRSLDDLRARVHGIGPAVIAGLRPVLRVAPVEIRVARGSP